MSDDKSPLEQAIDQAMDAFVYAPIGLIFDGPDLFPKLAERGRNQVQTARMMGEMVVKMGQSEAEKRAARTQGPLRDALSAVGVVPPKAPAPTTDPATATGATAAPPRPEKVVPEKAAPRKPAPKKVAAKKAVTKAAAAKKAAPPKSSSLGIPDYDSLSASQVVKRLQGMPGSELDAVRAYEAATRARKTILNRITQLQKG